MWIVVIYFCFLFKFFEFSTRILLIKAYQVNNITYHSLLYMYNYRYYETEQRNLVLYNKIIIHNDRSMGKQIKSKLDRNNV